VSDSTGSYALARTVIQLFETENNQLLVTMPQQGIDPPWLVRPLEELASWLTSVSPRCVSKAPA